jgi:assimilatory nitrate reductase catalytic subunit
MACPKGWEALTPLRAEDRATTPLWRDGKGRMQPVSWDTAACVFVERFRRIIDEHGPDSVAFLSTGQIPTEEMALLGAFAKFGMGMVHGDGNTRQCMATSVVAYKQAFGFDAPPYTYADFEASDVVVLWGSNLCVAHPIMWERVVRNPNNPEIIVLDPRTTETASAATLHVPLAPKSDLVLAYGIGHVLVREGWVDQTFVDAHVSGFAEYVTHVAAFTPERVAAETGLAIELIERLARVIHEGKAVSFWWTMGVNQSHEAVRTAQAIIDLALITGNIGRPGTGANSITGQCNAMGSRLFSNTVSLFGGRDWANEAHRSEVADALGIDVDRIPQVGSWAYDQIIEAAADGRLKGLWVIATNSAHSWIDQRAAREALGRLDFLVVQDMYSSTDTAQLADLVLPAAGWGEKEGTFINSERRIGVIKRVAQAPGQALADFYIFKLLADAWGCSDLFADWRTPEDAFAKLRDLSAGRPCDFTGVDGYGMVDDLGGVQWPFPAGAVASPKDNERRLFAEGVFFTDDGKARLIVDEPRPTPETTSGDYPLVLLTGRGSSSQWHTQTRTGKSEILMSLATKEPWCELAPRDATARDLASGDWAVVASARGSMRAKVVVTTSVGEGQVFVPMHYVETNRLTRSEFDPHSRQPSYKHAAVEVRRAKRRDR